MQGFTNPVVEIRAGSPFWPVSQLRIAVFDIGLGISNISGKLIIAAQFLDDLGFRPVPSLRND